MEITIRGNFVTVVGYLAGLYLADIGGAEVWQALIAGAANAIALLVITPGATE